MVFYFSLSFIFGQQFNYILFNFRLILVFRGFVTDMTSDLGYLQHQPGNNFWKGAL